MKLRVISFSFFEHCLLQNNTKSLGPKHDTLIEGGPPAQSDPCIGRIVEGEDTLIRLKRIEHDTDGVKERLFQDISLFEDAVTIKSAKIVSRG